MAINSINSRGYNFGSLASIKKQAQAVADRVEAESKARKAQQEATGLMKNAKGELVEISSIPEWEREVLEQRAIDDSVSPKEALLAALATRPNGEKRPLHTVFNACNRYSLLSIHETRGFF